MIQNFGQIFHASFCIGDFETKKRLKILKMALLVGNVFFYLFIDCVCAYVFDRSSIYLLYKRVLNIHGIIKKNSAIRLIIFY